MAKISTFIKRADHLSCPVDQTRFPMLSKSSSGWSLGMSSCSKKVFGYIETLWYFDVVTLCRIAQFIKRQACISCHWQSCIPWIGLQSGLKCPWESRHCSREEAECSMAFATDPFNFIKQADHLCCPVDLTRSPILAKSSSGWSLGMSSCSKKVFGYIETLWYFDVVTLYRIAQFIKRQACISCHWQSCVSWIGLQSGLKCPWESGHGSREEAECSMAFATDPFNFIKQADHLCCPVDLTRSPILAKSSSGWSLGMSSCSKKVFGYIETLWYFDVVTLYRIAQFIKRQACISCHWQSCISWIGLQSGLKCPWESRHCSREEAECSMAFATDPIQVRWPKFQLLLSE